jgi:IPT/TIG domain-containing protein
VVARLSQPGIRFLVLLVAAAVIAFVGVQLAAQASVQDPGSPFWGWFGALTVLALWSISGTLTGDWNPLALAMGADNRLSTSKFQVLLWTATVGFVYVMVYADRVLKMHEFHHWSTIPQNVLIALGISVTSSVAAAAITGSQAAANPSTKNAKSAPSYDPAALVRNDNEATASLTKVQLLFWTVVAVVVYLITSFGSLGTIVACTTAATGNCPLPDIDTTLMLFMGLGHATYIGGKLASTVSPTLSNVAGALNAATAAGRTITLTGNNLGTTVGTISLNGVAFPPTDVSWSPTSVSFAMPAKPGGGAWTAGDNAVFVVTVNGNDSPAITYVYA